MSVRNWRRGLFRLWFLVTAVWIVCVLSFVSISGEAGQKWKEYRLAQAYEKMILRMEDGIKAGGLTDNQGKFVDVTQLTSDLGGMKSRQTGVDEKSKLAAKWLYRLLGFLLVPALSLLVLGRAAVWVADGFGTGNQKYLK